MLSKKIASKFIRVTRINVLAVIWKSEFYGNLTEFCTLLKYGKLLGRFEKKSGSIWKGLVIQIFLINNKHWFEDRILIKRICKTILKKVNTNPLKTLNCLMYICLKGWYITLRVEESKLCFSRWEWIILPLSESPII